MVQNRMQDVKRATGAQVRGQLDDQDSQKTEIYGSRGRESALKRVKTSLRHLQGCSKAAHVPMQDD